MSRSFKRIPKTDEQVPDSKMYLRSKRRASAKKKPVKNKVPDGLDG